MDVLPDMRESEKPKKCFSRVVALLHVRYRNMVGTGGCRLGAKAGGPFCLTTVMNMTSYIETCLHFKRKT